MTEKVYFEDEEGNPTDEEIVLTDRFEWGELYPEDLELPDMTESLFATSTSPTLAGATNKTTNTIPYDPPRKPQLLKQIGQVWWSRVFRIPHVGQSKDVFYRLYQRRMRIRHRIRVPAALGKRREHNHAKRVVAG